MHPIYVLEGPDGAGKTTLAEQFVKQHGAHYIHMTYRWKKQMFTYHWGCLEHALVLARTQPVVIDRWWPSINIYDDEFRGRRDFPMAGRFLDRAGLANGIVYIMCLPSNSDIHERRFHEKAAAGQEMYDSVSGVTARYQEWYKAVQYRADWLRYDWITQGRDMDMLVTNARRRWLQMNSRISPEFANNRQFAGNMFAGHPKALIVGERSNPKNRHGHWPFFEYGNSSLWLAECLEEAGVAEYDLVWANAFDTSGWAQPGVLKKVFEKSGTTKIVAMGNKADQVVWSAGLRSYSEKMHHPAYANRFKSALGSEFRNEYVEDLRRIAG